MALPEHEVEENMAALDNMVAELRVEMPYYRLGQAYFNALDLFGVDPQFADEIRGGPLDPFHDDSLIEPMKQALRAWWGEDKPPHD